MTARIEDYALIGDCETAALVSRDGSIDWLCWPRFDSGACFAAILGDTKNGRWKIAPAAGEARLTRRYRGDTMILETQFETDDGAVCVTDFMPIGDGYADIVRIVTGLRGRVDMCCEVVLRFSYGAIVPWVNRQNDGRLCAVAGPDMVMIKSDVELHGVDLTTVGEFTIAEGQRKTFVMTWGPSHLKTPPSADPDAALADTEAFWSEWASQCTYKGEWRDAVMRSLLTLKALTYAPTGGIVAAPTTSLPEQIGGERNWDYRYCWLRDATFTLYSFLTAGFEDEARAWRDWLIRAVAGRPEELQIMYGVAGERRLTELQLDWLPGFEDSKPVRVGNAATDQFQLDVYGEVLDLLHAAGAAGMDHQDEVWRVERSTLDFL